MLKLSDNFKFDGLWVRNGVEAFVIESVGFCQVAQKEMYQIGHEDQYDMLLIGHVYDIDKIQAIYGYLADDIGSEATLGELLDVFNSTYETLFG